MTNNKKIILRQETSLATISNQFAITNKILKSIKDVQLPVFGTFTDQRDGNVYKTVKIGEQVWIAENLKYMPHVCPSKEQGGIWVIEYEGNDIEKAKETANYKKFGCLYNWETANSICPIGWHIPNFEEWKSLILFITSIDIKNSFHWQNTLQEPLLKSNTGWSVDLNGNDSNGNDRFGFNALPAGFRSYKGYFCCLGIGTSWWLFENYFHTICGFPKYFFLTMGDVEDGGFSMRLIKNT